MKILEALLDHKFFNMKKTTLFICILSSGNNLEPCIKQMCNKYLLNILYKLFIISYFKNLNRCKNIFAFVATGQDIWWFTNILQFQLSWKTDPKS